MQDENDESQMTMATLRMMQRWERVVTILWGAEQNVPKVKPSSLHPLFLAKEFYSQFHVTAIWNQAIHSPSLQ